MGPLFFQSLPEIYSYGLAVAMVQVCILLLVTGKRFLKQVSITVSALVGAVLGETIAISLNAGVAWLGIGAGIVGGALIGRYIRPAGVGLALSYLAFSAAGNLANVAYLGWVAALVIFAYGLLLTDLAPTFVSSLLSCSILVLIGEWAGITPSALLVLTTAVGAARIMASILPSRLALRAQRQVLSQ
jgi:hypothetical protein